MVDFAKKVGQGQQRCLGGNANAQACIDLFIADVLDGLRVPNVSKPPMSVPSWNAEYTKFVEHVFEFADGTLNNDGAIMLFLPEDPTVKKIVKDKARTYGYKLLHEIWETKRFYIALFVSIEQNDVLGDSKFSIDTNMSISGLDKDVQGKRKYKTTSEEEESSGLVKKKK